MSLTHLNSSLLGTSCLNELALNASLANSESPQYNCSEQRVFQVAAKPLGYVIGEQFRNFFDFFYSKLPTFSIPGAQPSPVGSCSEILLAADHCKSPTGSYLDSCHEPTVTYLPDEDKCLLETRCATIFEALAPKVNELKFNPKDSLVLGNQNGTLTVLDESKYSCISPKEANAKLDQTFKTVKEIDRELDDRAIEDSRREKLEHTRKELLKKQGDIIGRLNAGDVITLDDDRRPVVITPENKESHKGHYCTEAFTSFQRLASSTGGIMGLSRSSDHLPLVVEKLFNHILHTVQPDEFLDIAFVLDTTSSMSDDIAQVQRNLLTFLERLKDEKVKVRVALLEYRDKDDAFLNRVNTDFTTDLHKVEEAVKSIKVAGGADRPEAVFDALLTAKNELSWDENAKHVAILIGDAPPHHKTIDNQHDESAVIEQFQAKDIEIAIYPILT